MRKILWDESVNVETITVVPAASSTAKVEISEAAKVESITVDSSAESATAEIKVAENVTVPNFDVVGDGDVVIDNSGEIGLSGMKIDTAAKLLIALQIGGTVDLAGDITTSQQLIVKENISVTLNLHGVLAADGGKMIVNGGNYLLGNGSAGSCYRMAYTSDYGVIEINAGTFTRNVDNNNAFFGAYFAHSEDSENIIINGGTFTDAIHGTIKVDGSGDADDAYGGYYGGYTVISGGTFSGEIQGTMVKDNRQSA